MRNSTDPSLHRDREQQFTQHVERLLDDPRLRVDTLNGARPVPAMIRSVEKSDRGTDLKREMSAMNLPDRELQAKMPLGQRIEVTLSQSKWFIFKKTVGRMRLVCVSPTRDLLAGKEPKPLGTAEVNKILSEMPPSLGGVPTTIVLLSTSGFTIEAHEVTERRADRTLILAEPNDAGGWSVWGPPEKKALVDLFDAEAENEKRRRIREAVEASRADLLGGGIAADRVASSTQLPLQLVEAEVKSYAKENPGLAAKRLDGRVVLFREGTSPAPPVAGGSMPLIDKLRTLFSRKGENEKKIAFLSERRAALSQQRDRAYEEIGAFEQKDEELRTSFKATTSPVTRRRITSQLVQLRKDIERRQQLLGVLNQQVNVVSTHLHNLELVQQGTGAKLPDSEEIATDAAAAEEMLAQLQADNELADSVGTVAHASMSAEEQALYEELEREAGGPQTTQVKLDTIEEEHEIERRAETRAQSSPARPQRQKGEAEPG
jgi:hypothetical protein